MGKLYTVSKNKTRSCDSNHDLPIAKFRLKLEKVEKKKKKVEETTRPFRDDLNQITLWLYSGSEKQI